MATPEEMAATMVANLIALKTLESGAADTADEDLLAAQYGGKKAGLRPIYDALLAAISGFGAAVEISPKKSYVSLRRRKQFALVQPSTMTRVDVGLNLKGMAAGGRLEASGSFNSMCTHRVRVTDVSQVDTELVGWLREAFERAG